MRWNMISLNQFHLTCSQVEVLSHDSVTVAAMCTGGDLLPIGTLLSLLLCTSSVINCSLRQLIPLHLLPLLLMTAAGKWRAASYLIQRTTQHAGWGNKTWRHFIKTSRNTFSPELTDGLDSVKVSTPSPDGLSLKKSLNSPPAPPELKASLIWIKDGV